jgi:glycosyltransferase involved in cell wall biosynthesis
MSSLSDTRADAPERLSTRQTDGAREPLQPRVDQASVIICAYSSDRWGELRNAVGSVASQTVQPREVTVVVDNNPQLLARAREQLQGVGVVANHNSRGASGARNTGADLASGSVLVFLDYDGIATPDWLAEHLRAYTDPDVLGVGGEVTPAWLTERPCWWPAELDWVIGCTFAGMPQQSGSIRNPVGGNMSVRAEVFAAVGGFRPELARLDLGNRVVTGTADETEFCIRVSQRYPRGRWLYRPAARTEHVVPPERATWKYFVGRCRLEGCSKAVLVGLRGRQAGLASERRYATRVLPRAAMREMGRAIRREPHALRRGGAICAGFAITAWAYLRARVAISLGRGERTVCG